MAKQIWTSLTLVALLLSYFASLGESANAGKSSDHPFQR